MKIAFARILSVFTGFLVLTSCGTVSYNYLVKRPAEINLKGLKKIAISDFSGKNPGHCAAVMNGLQSQLIESAEFEAVLDRKHLDSIMDEHKLKMTGLTDESGIQDLGKFTGAAAMVYGSISVDDYKEITTVKEKITVNTNRTEVISVSPNMIAQTVTSSNINTTYNTKIITNSLYDYTYSTNYFYTRNGIYTLSVNYQIVDIQTAKIITAKTLTASRENETRSKNSQPDLINSDLLFVSCAGEVSALFVRQLVPYYAPVEVKFQTDQQFSDSEQTIELIKQKKYAEAIQKFQSYTIKPNLEAHVRAKAFYDLGMALMLNSQFDEAAQNVGKAQELNSGEQLYREGMDRIVVEKNNYLKLKEQQ